MSKKDGGASKAANQAKADEAARQATVRQGTQAVNDTFSQFNDPYFEKQRTNYLNFALPQLDDQYGKAQKTLTYALARDGNLNSSAQAYQNAELQKTYDTQRLSIADQGQNFANQARSSVEDARGNLISTLNATGDATQAAQSAAARAGALSAPQGYSPIGDAFGAILNGVAVSAQNSRAQALLSGKPISNAGLFGSTANAVKTTA
ncbi:hypothetical protein ASF41_10470 [Methylobacterium sp. Leaf111]|uniref:hypothetical protein n=1 Tax=Methylobacterium sp. Leaf111 TaxID=1736257 RepID=UPI0006F45B28|nr:hypothetical protein [Methylobacterium sp. Leaf111]KQP60093.1 hypothetical protein ASF41_10470 [Methylobacterium sp. Leaf111]